MDALVVHLVVLAQVLAEAVLGLLRQELTVATAQRVEAMGATQMSKVLPTATH